MTRPSLREGPADCLDEQIGILAHHDNARVVRPDRPQAQHILGRYDDDVGAESRDELQCLVGGVADRNAKPQFRKNGLGSSSGW